MARYARPTLALALLLALNGCGQSEQADQMTPPPMGPEPQDPPIAERPTTEMQSSEIVAASDDGIELRLLDTADLSKDIGSVLLVQTDSGLEARFNVPANSVIEPGEHAIHLHENGDCSAKDTNSDGQADPGGAAGGHYNPTNVGHGEDNGPHAGDPEDYNYTFADDGSFDGTVVFANLTLDGEVPARKPGGTAIVVHGGTDDKNSDPAGNAGPRVACAVIDPA